MTSGDSAGNMAFAGQEIADCMNAGGREKRL